MKRDSQCIIKNIISYVEFTCRLVTSCVVMCVWYKQKIKVNAEGERVMLKTTIDNTDGERVLHKTD